MLPTQTLPTNLQPAIDACITGILLAANSFSNVEWNVSLAPKHVIQYEFVKELNTPTSLEFSKFAPILL